MTKRSNTSDHPNIMVSSTYADLVKHRKAVVEALVRLDFFPIGMEFDSAKAGKDIIASSLEMVGKADAYIGLLSHRYGGVPKDTARNPDELSITELEYREALRCSIPVFMFLMSDDHPVRWQDVEAVEAYQAKLKRLKDDARARSICAEFSSVDELVARVLQSMAEFKAQLAQARAEEEPRSSTPSATVGRGDSSATRSEPHSTPLTGAADAEERAARLEKLRVLIKEKRERLFERERQEAMYGISADPAITIEIKRLKKEIDDLKLEAQKLEGS